MGLRALPALAVVLVLAAPLAGAAVDPDDLEPVGPADAAYLDAVRWGGLQTDIVYLRPSVAFDPWDFADGRRPEPPRQLDPETARKIWITVFAVLLAAVIAFVAWYGGRIPVSFRDRSGDGRRRTTGTEAPAADTADLPTDAFLDRLRGMADRRLALILLTGRALESAAAANGLRLGRAQTARDVLRALPRRWPHFEALRRLVGETELVHFGGRDLPETRWCDCIEAARPLLAGGRPA